MILSFSQKWLPSMGKWAGQPTYFIARIWMSLVGMEDKKAISNEFATAHVSKLDKHWDVPGDIIAPKLHTLREDQHDNWHAGRPIQFAINPRSKNYFQFAPTIPCVSTQTIQIIDSAYTRDNSGITIEYSHNHNGGVEEYVKHWEVIVDGIRLKRTQIEDLAINDGFESVEQFFAWFNRDWKGKIIHWTNLKY